MASTLNFPVYYLLRFLNSDFGAFLTRLKRNFQENFAKIAPKMRRSRNSKIEANSYSKFQAKILKNIVCEAFLVDAIG